MMTTDRERRLIDEYLARLEHAAQGLPADRRAELLGEIREHIDTALGGADAPSGEAAVRDVLDRLGSPEEIVEAASDGPAAVAPSPGVPGGYSYGYGYPGGGGQVPGGPVFAPRRSLALEIWAVVMLTLGSILLPVIGWIVGVVLLWTSDRWRLREKLIGTLIVPGGWGAVALAVSLGGLVTSCFTSTGSSSVDGTGTPVTTTTGDCGSGPNWVTIGVFAVLGLASLLTPFVLLHLARKRAGAPAAAFGANDIHPVTGSRTADRPLGQI